MIPNIICYFQILSNAPFRDNTFRRRENNIDNVSKLHPEGEKQNNSKQKQTDFPGIECRDPDSMASALTIRPTKREYP